MERKFVRLILYEGDHEILVPDDLGLPYENLVDTAYELFDQDPTRVRFSLHFKTKDHDDSSNYLIDQKLWNMGKFFSASGSISLFHCRFTPIEQDDTNHPDLGTFGSRRDSVHQASPDVQPFSRCTGTKISGNDSTPSLQDNMETFTSDDTSQEPTPEQQPKRKASPRALQDSPPQIHKRIRPFSPRQYLPTKQQAAAKVGTRGVGRGSYHRKSAVPQSPGFSTRRRETRQKSDNVQDLPEGQQCETDATGSAQQPDPGLVRTPQARASSTSSSSLSPVPEHLFLTPPRCASAPRRASADGAFLRNRAQGFQNVVDTSRRVSFDSRVLGQGTEVTEDAAGLYLDSVEAGAHSELSRHGAPGRKNKSIDLTFFFKSEIKGHSNLKVQDLTVTYQGNETLKKREKEIRNHICNELYNNNPRISERQRQGVINELAIFIYVYYQNTDDRQDMLDRKYTNHDFELWEFLLADIKDSEPAKLNAAITMHRNSDVDMRLFERLSPTKSRPVEGDDDEESEDDFVVADPIDNDARLAEDQDGEYEGDGEENGNESDGGEGDGNHAGTSPLKNDEA